MAATAFGQQGWAAGPTLTGLNSAAIASGAAPVTSGIVANPFLSGSSALAIYADLVLTLGTAETATSAGGWIAAAILKASTASIVETARVSGNQLYPFDDDRYGQAAIVPSAAYTSGELIVIGGLLVPRSPYIAVAVFNNSSFSIPTTATWTLELAGGDIG